jgi:hypothetical protein
MQVSYEDGLCKSFARQRAGQGDKKVRHIATPASRSVTSEHQPVGISQSADQLDGAGAARSHKVGLFWQNWLYAVGRSTVPVLPLMLA